MKHINNIIILLMSLISDSFFAESPKKILDRADLYSKTISNFHELPKANNKSRVVNQLAEDNTKQIQFAISQSQYQNSLFRNKEAEDLKTRNNYEQKIKSLQDKVVHNGKEIQKKMDKKAEEAEKHLKEVYKRFEEKDKKERLDEKEQSTKIRKELLEFFKLEEQRKKKAEKKQVSVSPCYESAVQRINNIHKKNEEFAMRAEEALNKQLTKNNHFGERINQRRLSASLQNKKKKIVYRHSVQILHDKHQTFVQKYGENEDGSLSCWKHIDQQCNKTKKRLGQFFKKRHQRWHEEKKKVDEKNTLIPEKCTCKLEKTSRASFRNTMSTFRSTPREWENIVHTNKKSIKQYDEMKKDEIMGLHLDLRLLNKSSSKINDKMKSMRSQAKKLAYEFL